MAYDPSRSRTGGRHVLAADLLPQFGSCSDDYLHLIVNSSTAQQFAAAEGNKCRSATFTYECDEGHTSKSGTFALLNQLILTVRVSVEVSS